MLEWLVAATGIELGKLVLEQVLNLGKAALEDYVKDFFKDCIQTGVARANAETLKKPMAEAVGFFIKRFVKELQINDVPEMSIEHHYKGAIKRFVQDKSVRPLLGKAFETDCKQIDYVQLQRIWTQNYQEAGWQFPVEEFDWRGVAKEYGYEVKGIIKANAELRSLLETELLETIARNTANLNTQISPGFDVAKYRDSLQCSYGYLKLYTLDSSDRTDAIKLWNMFIEQTVREALPPLRYELPLDLKRQLQQQGQLETDLSSEALERYRQEYFQQPARKVLEAIEQIRSPLAPLEKGGTGIQSPPLQGGFRGIESHAQRAVILGDPGAGKSTLLQYLALGWVEGETVALPLLIELREYAIAQVNNFLEFLHCGRGVDWQFDRQQLHQYLQEYPTIIMFDGLDEVFDRATQAIIIDDIIRFAQQYPKAQILITSRIIGYNPDRLQQANFRHFTIQPLDTYEIHEFIDRWYTLALGNDTDKQRLVTRLKDAIANSKAIQNLADNPLLLTMMAILNRRQELPRDRADLYDQASRVLLYHWDVDHKRLQLPMDAIGRREKQEMLRAIAYEMQAGEEGLKGNLISADRLTRILTDYLRDQGFSEPREKANLLIQQLRERNFILCYRGADTYGFVHRTFLEYFCAVEIVNRFEKQRTLTFEQLRDEVFGQHWQDETWHEVLRLICGAIDPKFVGNLIEFLMGLEVERSEFLAQRRAFLAQRPAFVGEKYGLKGCLKPEGLMNLLLAADCLVDVNNPTLISQLENLLLLQLQAEIEQSDIHFTEKAANGLLDRIARYFSSFNILPWLKQQVLHDDWVVRRETVKVIALCYQNDPDTLPWLKQQILQPRHQDVSHAAVWAIVENYKDNPDTLSWLQQRARQDKDWLVRRASMSAIFTYYKNYPDTLLLLKQRVLEDDDKRVRWAAVHMVADAYKEQPDTLPWLYERVLKDPHFDVRQGAVFAISEYYQDQPQTLPWLKEQVLQDADLFLKVAAVGAIASHYKDEPDSWSWLKENALSWLKESVKTHPDKAVQKAAFEALETIVEDDLNEKIFFLECFLTNTALRPEELQDKSTEEILDFIVATNLKKAELILREVRQNYPDEQLRQWAEEQLSRMNNGE
jgi:GTPase SAR1 family protein